MITDHVFKFAVKFFVDESCSVTQKEFVPVFHKWIQTSAVAGHQLIDVTDYSHVFGGPGIMLIAHEGNFSMDTAGGRLGLLYNRKHPLAGATSFAQRVEQVFGTALAACAGLQEAFPGRIRFHTGESIFRIHDRLLAPNDPATFAQIQGELRACLEGLYGGSVRLEHRADAKRLFEVGIHAPETEVTKLTLSSKSAG